MFAVVGLSVEVLGFEGLGRDAAAQILDPQLASPSPNPMVDDINPALPSGP